MSMALVYVDQGVCLPSAEALVKQLTSLLDPAVAVLKVDGQYVKSQPWQDKAIVFVMGGGNCRYWDEQLGAEGVEKIQRYVLGGGKFMGFCAGAYFAAAESIFVLSNGSIKKSRPLAFFPGKAFGPLVENADYLSVEAARAANISFKIKGVLEMGSLYYQGGCFFDIEEDSDDVEIMGRYRSLDKTSAVICKCGDGLALLDGTHPEFKFDVSLGSESLYGQLAGKLALQEEFRMKVWQEIGSKLMLPVRTVNVKI